MITLCLDTSHKYMGIALLVNETIIDAESYDCFKKQSEYLLPKIDEMLKKHNYSPKDIAAIVVSKGPGSYTGVRIAMTLAKTIGVLTNVTIYTISTLRLYSANQKVLVVLDARSQRAYVGDYTDSDSFEGILELETLKDKISRGSYKVVGDGDLIGLETKYLNIGECFLNTKKCWEKVENIHTLVPEYFKSSEAYKTLQ